MKKIGYVYLTTNLVNGKQYVGQHLATEFDKSYKGSGTALKYAFKKYGWKNFKCKIVCWCSTQDELNYREQCEIVFHSTFTPNGYNLKYGGSNGKCRKESREKMSEAKKGYTPWNKGKTGVYSKDTLKKMEEAKKGHTPWNKGMHGVYVTSEETKRKQSITQINHPKKSKKVLQYTLSGEFVNEYPSLHEAARKNCVDVRGICSCCNGKIKSYKGSIWKHACSNPQETSSQTPQ